MLAAVPGGRSACGPAASVQVARRARKPRARLAGRPQGSLVTVSSAAMSAAFSLAGIMKFKTQAKPEQLEFAAAAAIFAPSLFAET